jgi:muramoyltetrapeptide carboxypeptidase LdcA involved in peptidoglycan recycling
MILKSPPKARPGDRVAVVSPSWAGPGVFPEVHDRSMRVVREQLDLVPVEFPTTRQVGASPKARAADLMAAFADPTIRAVLASIGGDDQITVLPHLDPGVVLADPKPFLGYSDNTNLLNWLWNLGVVGYHGGSTMVHLARPGGTHPVTIASLRQALFGEGTDASGRFEITPVPRFTDRNPDWADLATLAEPLPETDEQGWLWHHADRRVSGTSWGGNLEILHWNLAANRWIRPVEDYAGCVLLLETSEEMPSAHDVYRMLRNVGERGLLAQPVAVVVAKPKAWLREKDQSAEQCAAFRDDQYEAVLRAVGEYNPSATVVCGPDFGHTDPQYVLPYGGQVTIDGPARRFWVTG